MKRWFKQHDALPLWLATALAAVLFAVLYWQSAVPSGARIPPASSAYLLSGQQGRRELPVSAPLAENKDIYDLDANIYDVYISVFPTEDQEGNLLDFSCFGLLTSQDQDDNPTLDCNIQILPEGQIPDPLLDLDEENASIRVRGNTSRDAPYKNYRVQLKEGAKPFFGQKVLNLNKDYYDTSKLGAKLSTDLLAGIDNVLSYRTYFTRLWIRDASGPLEEQEFEYQGLYVELEQPNRAYLKARGLDENASLYKARDFTFTPNSALRDVDDPEYSRDAFEEVLGIREGGGSHRKLLEMLEAVNDPARNFEEVFAEYFNEENYLTWLAFNLLLRHEDILNHNFLLYSPENSKTWYFMHWDFDDGLRFGIFEGNQPESLQGVQKLLMVKLHRRYFQIPGNLDKLDAKMQELLTTSITRERVQALIQTYKPVLLRTLTESPDLGTLRCPPEQLIPYLDSLYDGILDSYESFKVSSQYPFSAFVAMPARTEDGAVRFAWDPFFSPKFLPVTYTIQIYTDYDRKNLVREVTGLRQTSYLMEEGLPDGTYYLLISGVDSEGWEQISLEHTEGWEGDVFYYKDGLLKFTLE